MSKELEYIQRQIDIVNQQVKGSKMKIIVTDAVTKHQYDYYERELQTLESIEEALQRLEAIDNSNPSEALECLEEWKYQINSYIDCSLDCRDIDTECYNHLMDELEQYYITIKQALLKQQELPEPFKTGVDIGVIKPKQYLKWEDLEFKEMYKIIPVRMGDNVYQMAYCLYENEGYIRLEDCQRIYLELFANEKKFFNDLHLEVEE